MKARLFFLFILTGLFAYGSPADNDPLKTILEKLERFRTQFPQEKVHLQLDKPYYSIGDTIWFKSYVVNSEKNQPSGLGRILYVELINNKDSIKQSLRLPLIAGLGWGSFTLTDSLKEGNYRIRSYTNWMRNFSDEFFFDKTIQIGNALSSNIVTNAEYSFSKKGISQQVLADISYSDLDGNPIAGKDVTYNIQLDFRNIANGKGTTDPDGHLKINFTNNQPFVLKSGKITTNLKLDDKVSVTETIPVKSTSDDLSLQFFPEGGQMVEDIRSRIGFKALRADGIGAEISGYITDKDNHRTTSFKSEHAGMGSFYLTPTAGNDYKAVITLNDGSEKSYELPKAAESGYVLSVDTAANDNIKIKIAVSKDIYDKGGEITLIGQTNDVLQYTAKTKLESPVLVTTLPKRRFPSGILHFTLFSTSNQPVAERLVFIKNNDQLRLSVSTDSPVYKKRGKVQMTLHVSDAAGKPVQGNFSLAVTDENKLPYDDAYGTSIFSDLLLTSDLKGYIESPGYYFTDLEAKPDTQDSTYDSKQLADERSRQLDNLMLTQGWRRFVWKNILSDNYPAINFVPEKSIEISGRVLTPRGEPVVGGPVSLFAASGNNPGLDTLTDEQGRFHFDNLYFTDSTKFIIQARNERGRNKIDIELNYTRPPLVTANKNVTDIEVNVNHSLLGYLRNRKAKFDEMRRNGLLEKNIVLSEVKVIEKKPDVVNSSNLNGAGNADIVIKSSDLNNCATLAECMQGRVLGVTIQNGIPFLTRNMSFGGGPMQIIVDGRTSDLQEFSAIVPSTVETIEVLKSGGKLAIYGLRGGNGVLVITTKQGQFRSRINASGIANISQQGYYIGRQFYSPDYDDPKVAKPATDSRSTIYWNPSIITDAEGKAEVEFFNADGTGNYKAIVEGLNDAGKLGRQVYRYTVQ